VNFASLEFLLFFAAFVPVFFALPRGARLPFLLAGSWFFYAWWNPAYLLLLAATTGLDYAAGRAIFRLRGRPVANLILAASVGLNLAVLFAFKYAAFVSTSLNALLKISGASFAGVALPVPHWVLPLGISFYTFHSISYMVDVRRGRIAAERDFLRYALYVCFFPLLVAGPIERAGHLIPQFSGNRRFDAGMFASGFTQVLMGFWKKLVIADALGFAVERSFSSPSDYAGGTLLLAVYAFAFQIYCDFSGYSDIALGTARMLGYDLSENFRAPYLSSSLTNFWRRWHVSLSSWLRDYVYIPLGGGRAGTVATCRNLLVTMLLGGLWHGAAWTFVLWGLLHGLWLCAEKLFSIPDRLARLPAGSASGWLLRLAAGIVVFHIVCLGWIFFRAESMPDAWLILTRIFDPASLSQFRVIDRNMVVTAAAHLLLLLALEGFWRGRDGSLAIFRPRMPRTRTAWVRIMAFNLFCIVSILLFGVETGSHFIYFQF
jgi:alginate O-acetyltransferase complex protein AlgI